MANQLSLIWDLIAVDHASGTFERVGAAAESTAGAMKGLFAGFAAIAAGEVVKTAIKQAADFQKQMLLIQTQSGDTTDNLGKMSSAILALAGPTAQAPEALATSLRHMTDVGLRGQAAIDAVKVAAEGAAVGHADLEATTNSLTSTIASGMVPAAETYSQVMGQLNAIVGAGDMSMTNLNDALSNGLLPTMHLYGVSLTQVGAALATFGDVNLRGQVAATDLRMAVQSFFKLTQDGPGILAKYHLSQQQLIDDLHQGGLTQALDDLHNKLVAGGVATNQWGEIITQVFGKKAGVGLATLLDEFDRYHTKLVQVTDGAGAFDSAWQKTTKTASFEFSQLKDTVDQVGVSLGTKLLPVAGDVASWLSQTGIPDAQKFGKELGGWFTTVEHSQGWQVFWSTTKTVFVDVRDDVDKLVTSFSRSGGLHDALLDVQVVGGVALGALKGLLTVGESTLGTLVHWFGLLPGPVQASVVAFVALRTATNLGWFDKLIGSEGSALSVLKNVGGGAATLGHQMTTSFGVAKQAQLDLMGNGGLGGTLVARATGNLAGLGAAAGEAAKGGFSALKSAGAGLMGLMGGPWGVAIAGATIGITALISSTEAYDAKIKQATDDVKKWNEQVAVGLGGSTANQALQNLDALKQKYADVTAKIDAYNAAAQGGYARGGIGSLVSQQQALKTELDNGTKAWDAQRASMSQLQIAQAEVDQTMRDYNMALKNNLPGSDAVTRAADRYRQAQQDLATATDISNAGLQTHLGLLEQTANQQLGMLNSALAVTGAEQQVQQAIDGYNAAAKDSGTTSGQLAQMQNALAQQVYQTTQQVGQAAADQAKANGVTDTASAANQAMLTYLQQVEKQLTGPSKAAVDQMISVLSNATITTDNVADATKKMGLDVVGTWDNNTQVLKSATDAQIKDLQNLGYTVTTLPDGKVVVTSDTGPARQQLDFLIKDYQNRQIAIAGGNFGPAAAGFGGVNPFSHMAGGGAVIGPGSGTSDTAGLYALSNGEHIWTAAETAAAGGHAAVEQLRANALRAGRGMAAGGPIFATYPARLSDAAMTQAESIIAQMFPPVTVTGSTGLGGSLAKVGVQALVQAMASSYGWGSGAEWTALAAVINRESGWNPNAANPTSSARGLFQEMASIYGPVPGSVQGQAAWGLPYIEGRYGDPLAAWQHELNYGWYDNGGPLHPGWTLAYNGTGKTEHVSTGDPGGSVVLQLDGPATVALLEGKAVTVMADQLRGVRQRLTY